MKDLRFKIIADFVKGGFDKAEGSIGNLKAKFTAFFSFSSVSWARIGSAATAGIAVMMKAGDALKNHFVAVFKEMEQSRIGFGQNMDSWLRKGGKMKTQNEKDRLIEDLSHEIQNMSAKRDEMIFEDSLDSRYDKAMEEIERQKNMAAGRGDFSDDELRLKRLDEQIFRAKKLRETLEKTEVKTPGKEFQDREDARFQEKSLESVSMKEREDMLARRLASAEEKMKQARDDLNRSPKNADLAEEANKQLDVVEKLETAYKAAKKAREDFEADIAAKNDLEKSDKADKEKQVEREKQARIDAAKHTTKEEEKKSDEEEKREERKAAIKSRIRTRMMRRGADVDVDEDGEDEFGVKRMRRGAERTKGIHRPGARGGLRWRAGAMASEAAGTPVPADDPQLRETKRTNSLLERIEKKTGAAP